MIKKIAILFLILFIFFSIKISKQFSQTNLLQKNISEKIQNGDLILRCGKSLESYTVLLADSSAKFSHIGIISIENQIPYVIHAVPWKVNTIKKEKLNEFINYKVASTYAIYRTKYNTTILKSVVNQANSFYQKKYTFDNSYDLTTNTKLYCTELILKAFKNAGINLKIKTKSINYVIGKHNLIFPSEFTKSPFFKKII